MAQRPKGAEIPLCNVANLRTTLHSSDAGMGHAYNEIYFQNTGSFTCHLSISDITFQRMDGKDGHSGKVRRGNLPIDVYRNVSVNTAGEGSPDIDLRPQQQSSVTTDWANRTGYTEDDVCATKVRIKLLGRPGILLDVSTQSCGSRVFVSRFHDVNGGTIR